MEQNKAEERALEAYPKDIEKYVGVNGVKSVVDNNSWQRAIFLKGYQQAEKDLALTWEDIEVIDQIFTDVFKDDFDVLTNEYYQEVLNRFNKLKKVI